MRLRTAKSESVKIHGARTKRVHYNHASGESKRDWILKAWEAGVVSAYDKPETGTATEVAI
jgi:hypothetical protein